ncbi:MULTISPECIES: DMT family transporter [unclassified Ruegeria]|uniref:DMT family transporter n=1 Tax=unclassified Ruegeria TaxID=2625375 RepID=UPI001489FD6B|nr:MULTISPECIES: DMT family transporter [unclassified Ruegeria]NOD75230.1 EamA family transporter [Ruegeria sp. HKCCD4332]NOD87191.1 EamA family transporter [Ruegeria sp. HKCCD4318]NOE12746.1 EamA family transporter [Ruegeria sp. HKCCD4318-2]NOG09088.1 DMT family transporter [Ruegeria sp. HKCCD4315]
MSHGQSHVFKAALWMTGAIASFSSMAVAGRELSFTHDTFEIMMYRSIVGFLVVALILTITQNWAQVSTKRLGLHAIRNTLHFTGQNLWFYAVAVAPLAQVFALEFTQPLWVILLSPLFLKERLTPLKIVAALIGFAGVLIVTRPGSAPLSPGLVTAALSAVFFAFTTITTKKLTRFASIGCIVFWLTAMQAVLGAAAAGFDGQISLPNTNTAPYLVLVGLAGLLAHFCITNALAIAPATVVVPFDFARLPTIAVVGMILYHEPIDHWVMIGAVVIFSGIFLNIWSENRSNLATTPNMSRTK